jgi:Tfp pilus assembly protein PilF
VRIAAIVFLGLSNLLNAGSLLDFSKGILAEERGDGARAAEYFEKAYLKDPISLPLARRIADFRLEANDLRGAVKVFETAIKARPEEPLVLIEYGDFLGRVGGGDALATRKREAAYMKVYQKMPGEYLPLERLIRFSREQENDDRARELLETLKTDSPEAVEYYVATTKSLYDSKDEAAQKRISELFEKSIDAHPEWAGTARSASDHFREKGNLERAIRILKLHTEAVPSSLNLRIRLGVLNFAAGNGDEGVEILERVLEVHPGKALAHESLAKYHREQGALEKARYHAAELLKIRGGSPEDFEKLGAEFLAANQPRDARLLLEKAVFYHPENVQLLMKLALATAKDPETAEMASRLFREVEAMLGNLSKIEPDFLLESARELIAQDQNAAAEERLRIAIRSFPETATRETAEALRALAKIWISESRNLDAARALISRAEALEK